MEPESCPVCWDILYKPYYALPCKHLYCKLCVHHIKAKRLLCPYCRNTIKDWKFNEDKALEIQEANPKLCTEKLREERILILKSAPWLKITCVLCVIVLLVFSDLQVMSYAFSYFTFMLGLYIMLCCLIMIFNELTKPNDNLEEF